MSSERLLSAAQRVLDGDESFEAAKELEGVLTDDYAGDERVEALVEVLARYTPGEGGAHAVPAEVRTVIRETLARVV